ncbi:MAG TPA: BMP family ABC transporter substrate-binding protein [Jatrophihabitans sp.]|jgi:simple sugar transport system substrate-binding protein/basic membrane protein A
MALFSTRSRRWRVGAGAVATVAALTVALTACSSSSKSGGSGGGGGGSDAPDCSIPSKGGSTLVGFITVGSTSDNGYNEAVACGAAQLAKADTDVTVSLVQNVPESDQVTQAMQTLVDKGAKIIFATSYGYFDYAQKFAAAHPDVVVLHQGGFITGAAGANFGTYWGQAFETVSLGGIAAGATTKSNKLGFVYAFPIPQTLANIDAFELGALKSNPKAQTFLENTSNWCDTAKQKAAANALLGQGVDVLTQHQDCQTTVIQAAKAAKASVVGYHFDAESVDPSGWLTGSAWNWAPVYEDEVKTVLAGSFKGSKYNANWVGSYKDGDSPLTLASFGTSVSSDLQSTVNSALADLKAGKSVFDGADQCQDGTPMFKGVSAGQAPTYDQINAISCLVKGVVGDLPKS